MITHEELESFYRKTYKPLVKSVLYSVDYNHADAEDIIQESFTRALKYRQSCNNKHISAWFARIVENTRRDWIAQNVFNRGMAEFDETVAEFDVDTLTKRAIIKDAMSVISKWENEKEKEILTLYYIQGFSVGEIMQITAGIKRKTWEIIQKYKESM